MFSLLIVQELPTYGQYYLCLSSHEWLSTIGMKKFNVYYDLLNYQFEAQNLFFTTYSLQKKVQVLT